MYSKEIIEQLQSLQQSTGISIEELRKMLDEKYTSRFVVKDPSFKN